MINYVMSCEHLDPIQKNKKKKLTRSLVFIFPEISYYEMIWKHHKTSIKTTTTWATTNRMVVVWFNREGSVKSAYLCCPVTDSTSAGRRPTGNKGGNDCDSYLYIQLWEQLTVWLISKYFTKTQLTNEFNKAPSRKKTSFLTYDLGKLKPMAWFDSIQSSAPPNPPLQTS